MITPVISSVLRGIDARAVNIECDITNGLPAMVIVGMGNKSIDESKERIRSSLLNSGLNLPRKRITINLAPADLPKDGSGLDVPIAIAILAASGQISPERIKDVYLIGELSLDGYLRPVKGIISHIKVAQEMGASKIIIPPQNSAQAGLLGLDNIYSVDTLRELYRSLADEFKLVKIQPSTPIKSVKLTTDFKDISGQNFSKRALEIAAAGHHNVLMTGPPGAGKTMMAKALTSILPPLSNDEITTTTHIHSLVSGNTSSVSFDRPFRSPHHTSSHISLVGGGKNPLPGEISLAHNGVLFMDELPEFQRNALEALRQPLEDCQVTVARAAETVTYPANFMLIATQNPCPCGYLNDTSTQCTCSALQINNYNKKVSGPLLDRIDIVVPVTRIKTSTLLENKNTQEPSADILERVIKARQIQTNRFKSLPYSTNSQMTNRSIKKFVNISPETKGFLDNAAIKLNLTARSYMKTLRVARTIADLNNNEAVETKHLAEALQYRYRPSPL